MKNRALRWLLTCAHTVLILFGMCISKEARAQNSTALSPTPSVGEAGGRRAKFFSFSPMTNISFTHNTDQMFRGGNYYYMGQLAPLPTLTYWGPYLHVRHECGLFGLIPSAITSIPRSSVLEDRGVRNPRLAFIPVYSWDVAYVLERGDIAVGVHTHLNLRDEGIAPGLDGTLGPSVSGIRNEFSSIEGLRLNWMASAGVGVYLLYAGGRVGIEHQRPGKRLTPFIEATGYGNALFLDFTGQVTTGIKFSYGSAEPNRIDPRNNNVIP